MAERNSIAPRRCTICSQSVVDVRFDICDSCFSKREKKRGETRGRAFVIKSPEHYFACLYVLQWGASVASLKEFCGDNQILFDSIKPFLRNLGRVDGDRIQDGVIAFLRGCSPERRKQISVYARGDDFLQFEHDTNLSHFERQLYRPGKHINYIENLAAYSGVGPYAVAVADDQKLTNLAAVGAAMICNNRRIRDAETTQKGRRVLCASCATWHFSSETQRIKPKGKTRYMRLCNTCATAFKASLIG